MEVGLVVGDIFIESMRSFDSIVVECMLSNLSIVYMTNFD